MFDTLHPIIIFLFGSSMLYYGSEYLISNASLLAKMINIPSIIVGATILAFGTSLPELIVSIKASYYGYHNLIIGNIIGSNISNICLVFGVVLVFFHLKVFNFNALKSNVSSLLFITIVFIFFVLMNNSLNIIHGLILLFLFFLYLYLTLKKHFLSNLETNTIDGDFMKILLYIILSALLVAFGSELFLEGAVGLAKIWEVDNSVIGLTLVALGTSIPEFFVSVSAAIKKEYDFVIGNVIGSNIINIVLVGGLTFSINNVIFSSVDFWISSFILMLVTFLLILINIQSLTINRILGSVFIIIYFIFLYLNFK